MSTSDLTLVESRFHSAVVLTFNKDLFVRIQEVEGSRAPVPRPLESGFSIDRLYRVLGIYTPSETAEAYFILPNDRDELWFISQRHLRFGLLKQTQAQHLPLPAPSQLARTVTESSGGAEEGPRRH